MLKDTQRQKRLFLLSPNVQNGIGSVLLLGVLWCMFRPDSTVYKAQFAVGLWLLGLLFLAFRYPRLTMWSFGACALLSLYLRSTTNTDLQPPPKNNAPKIKIAHFNLSAFKSDIAETLLKMEESGADVISVQEISPEWVKPLLDSFSKRFRHRCAFLGTDLYSFALFSKLPIAKCDTFFYNSNFSRIPNLMAKIELVEGGWRQPITILNSYIEPPILASARAQQDQHFKALAKKIEKMNAEKMPVLAVGNYNSDPTSTEIQTFRATSALLDSRRGFQITRKDGKLSLLDVPLDHIFYSNALQCLDFQTLSGSQGERVGIMGIYQINKN